MKRPATRFELASAAVLLAAMAIGLLYCSSRNQSLRPERPEAAATDDEFDASLDLCVNGIGRLDFRMRGRLGYHGRHGSESRELILKPGCSEHRVPSDTDIQVQIDSPPIQGEQVRSSI